MPAIASGSEMVRRLQERAARAIPAEHVRDAGGWWLRHAPRSSWWVGTVLPHGDAGPGELVQRVAGAEEFYAARGTAARFQISPGACPQGLDTVLAERGYRREGPVSLQVATTADVLNQAPATARIPDGTPASTRIPDGTPVSARIPDGTAVSADALDDAPAGTGNLDGTSTGAGVMDDTPASAGLLDVAPVGAVVPDQAPAPTGELRVRVDDGPTRAWLRIWHAVHEGDVRTELDMLDRVERPSAYASAMIGDGVVAVGRAVADAGWVGVFSMATLPQARGRGAARAVLAALAGWALANRVDHMYLQVERDNAPALRLYDRSGFGEICAYHYRTAG